MSGKLLNVRLNAQDAALASELRKRGVNISELVRTAIHQKHASLSPPGRRRSSAAVILDRIFEKFPIPPEAYPPPLDLTDRRAVQAAIREHLQKKSSHGSHRYQRTRRSA